MTNLMYVFSYRHFTVYTLDLGEDGRYEKYMLQSLLIVDNSRTWNYVLNMHLYVLFIIGHPS